MIGCVGGCGKRLGMTMDKSLDERMSGRLGERFVES